MTIRTEVKNIYEINGYEVVEPVSEICRTKTKMREIEVHDRRFTLAYIPALDISVCFEYWARIGNYPTNDYVICDECGQCYVDYVCGNLEDIDTIKYLIESIEKYINKVTEPWNE